MVLLIHCCMFYLYIIIISVVCASCVQVGFALAWLFLLSGACCRGTVCCGQLGSGWGEQWRGPSGPEGCVEVCLEIDFLCFYIFELESICKVALQWLKKMVLEYLSTHTRGAFYSYSRYWSQLCCHVRTHASRVANFTFLDQLQRPHPKIQEVTTH